MFVPAVMGLGFGISNLLLPLHDASHWQHWNYVGWFLFAAVFFYRAYRRVTPDDPPELPDP